MGVRGAYSVLTSALENLNNIYQPMNRSYDLPFQGDEELQNAWLEWEQHRKEKKQKLTPLSVKKQLKFLTGRSKAEIIAIIDQSIMNGYQGLFELKKPLQPQMKVIKFTIDDLNQKTG